MFVIVVLLPILVAINGVARFRAGLIGIISVEIMLLMDLINSFLYFNTIPTVSGEENAAAGLRAVSARMSSRPGRGRLPSDPCLALDLGLFPTPNGLPPSPPSTGALLARGRVVAAGSIIGVIGLFFVVIGLGIHDERDPSLHMKRMGVRGGETMGGVYVDPDTDIANVMTYNNPLSST